MRVLVTGGAGFIGSHVVDAYLEEGHEVLVIDDLSRGSSRNVDSRAEFEELDVGNQHAIAGVFASFHPEVVNHHAARIDPRLSVSDPLGDERVNVAGTVNLLQASVEVGARAFVFASSGGAIYGEQADAAGEDIAKAPLSPYGAAKLAAETYLFVFSRTLNLPAVALRYSNVYGPRQGLSGEAGVIPIFIRRMLDDFEVSIFGDGEQTRDFVYVGDVVRANLLATDYLLDEKPRETSVDDLGFNISSGVAISINDLFARLARAIGYSRSPIHEGAKRGDIRHSVLSSAKAEEILGFLVEVPFDEGLQATVEWFEEQSTADCEG